MDLENKQMQPWLLEKMLHTILFLCAALEDKSLSDSARHHLHCALYDGLKILAFVSGRLDLWNRELVKKYAYNPEKCEEFIVEFKTMPLPEVSFSQFGAIASDLASDDQLVTALRLKVGH